MLLAAIQQERGGRKGGRGGVSSCGVSEACPMFPIPFHGGYSPPSTSRGCITCRWHEERLTRFTKPQHMSGMPIATADEHGYNMQACRLQHLRRMHEQH